MAFFADQPLGYHVANLVLHIGSGILVWRLFHLLGLRWGWLGGALFVVHPLSVESVAWVSEVKNALSLPILLLALIAYLEFDRNKKEPLYVASIVLYVAAMLSKTSVVMLPALVLLYYWWKKARITGSDLRRTAPFFLIALVLGFITIHMQTPEVASDVLKPRSPLDIFLCAGQAIFFYLGHFLFPIHLIPIYPRWTFEPPTALQLLTWPVLLLFLVCLYLQKAWGRHVLFGVGFFLLFLLPVLGFVHFTYMTISWVADHFVYLPIIGLIGLTVAGLEYLYSRIRLVERRLLLSFVGVLLIGLMFESHGYSRVFADEETLWNTILERDPMNQTAYNNLGLIKMTSGNPLAAIPLFEKALQIDPDFYNAHSNLGTVLIATGDNVGGLRELREAVRIKPDYAVTHYNLGTFLQQCRQLPEAIEQLEIAVKISPDYADAQDNLGLALYQSGQAAEAIPHFRAALQVNPRDINAHYYLGLCLIEVKQIDEGTREFEAILRIDPNSAAAQKMLEKIREFETSHPATN